MLIHWLKETKRENKRQTITIFEAFLREALDLKPDFTETIHLHRLPQHAVKKADKKVTRPIIVKSLSTYDKDMLYENIFKLKAYNKNRVTSIFITEHLLKIFYNQKLLIP